jgi:hypothetical protein
MQHVEDVLYVFHTISASMCQSYLHQIHGFQRKR